MLFFPPIYDIRNVQTNRTLFYIVFFMMDASNLINLVYRNLRKMFCGKINKI